MYPFYSPFSDVQAGQHTVEMVGFWFEHDVNALLDEKLSRIAVKHDPLDSSDSSDSSDSEDSDSDTKTGYHESWYSLLGGVINSMLHQLILMYFRYQSAGGKTDLYDACETDLDTYDTTNVAKLLMRIPTDWNQQSKFPIHPFDLQRWKSHLQDVEFDQMSAVAGGTRSKDEEERQLNLQVRDLNNGNIDDLMEEDDLDKAIKVGAHMREKDGELVRDLLACAGVEKEYYLPNDFADTTAL
jgi:hypothetical protein